MRTSSLSAAAALCLTANAISLESFGAAPDGISTLCGIAYGNTIGDCTTADFQPGATCSTKCQDGLKDTQNKLSRLCSGTKDLPLNSILAFALNGNLISAVCAAKASSSSTNNIKTTVKPETSTLKPTAAAGQSSSTGDTRTSTTSSKSVLSKPSISPSGSSSMEVTTSTTIQAEITKSSQSASASSSLSTTSTTTPTDAAVTPVSAQSHKKLTMQELQIIAVSHSGGGSPFDIVLSPNTATHAQNAGAKLPLVIFLAWLGVILGAWT